MFKIITPLSQHCKILTDSGKKSFLESHGTSASQKDLDEYISKVYTVERFEIELKQSDAIYKLVFYNNLPAAYSKMVFDIDAPEIPHLRCCKLERIYVLKEFYDKKIGKILLDINLQIAKDLKQEGMMLNVWTGNARAIRFYEREGFKKIGETGFKISETHSNPNYVMFLEF